MSLPLTRRELLKLTAGLSAGTLVLNTPSTTRTTVADVVRAQATPPPCPPSGAVVGAPPPTHEARRLSPLLAAGPTFTAIPSKLQVGVPNNISAGWDGTLWATADDGSPHAFDELAQAWQVYGSGIDAAAYADTEATSIIFFRGPEVFVTPTPPTTGSRVPLWMAALVAADTPEATHTAIVRPTLTPNKLGD